MFQGTKENAIELEKLDLSRFIRPGDLVSWGQASGEPLTLTEKLVEQRASFGGIRCFSGIPASETFRPEHADHLQFLSYCGTGANRHLDRAGVLEIFPGHYSSLPEVLSHGSLAVDVALLQVAPPDSSGRYSLGLADDYMSAILRNARIVIAEVNDQVPQTLGTNWLFESDINAKIFTSRPPAQMHVIEPTEQMRGVAKNVAALISDGSTLQLGLGGLPEAVLRELSDKNDLGIHSGLIGDGVADLMERGVITNDHKSLDKGVTVTGLIVGTRKMFEFVHLNPRVSLRGTDYTHDPAVLSRIDRFTAINSAIEIDLSGQINAEAIGDRYVGAVGGSGDFLRAAHHSFQGQPIIAMPATAGKRTKIVRDLNGPVTTSRADAGIIVTEYGAVDLRGKTIPERRELLVSIAAPEHRDELLD